MAGLPFMGTKDLLVRVSQKMRISSEAEALAVEMALGARDAGGMLDKMTPLGIKKNSGPWTVSDFQGYLDEWKANARARAEARAAKKATQRGEAERITGGPLEAFGRAPGPGRSLRLNPAVDFIRDDTTVPESDITSEDVASLDELFSKLDISGDMEGVEGGKRKLRGGATTLSDKLKFAKTIAMMVTYNTVWGVQAAGEAAKPRVVDYLKTKIIKPIYGTTSRTARILVGLADEIVGGAVTIVNLSSASFGYVANVISKIIGKFNAWGATTSEMLQSDPYAQAAADAAVQTWPQRATAVTVGVVALNQLGILPLSAILAGILFALKVNFGTGPGRAYVATSFYTWFVAQPPARQQQIITSAKEYATAAGTGATAAATTAAARLGPLLAQAGSAAAGATASAFAAIAQEVRAQPGASVPAGAESSAAAELATPRAIETVATTVSAPSVVAIAAESAAGTGGTSTPSGGRKKTAKRSMKRRATRRRKAPKYLAAPVFGRKGATFAY